MSLLPYRIAIQSLRMNRVRTALTTLGIIIGVASITLVLSLGSGAQTTVRKQVANLDNNMIIVKSGDSADDMNNLQQYNPYSISPITTLTELDLTKVSENDNIANIAPIMLLGGSAKTGDSSASNVTIVATSPELVPVLNLKVNPGQFIDNQTIRDTAVVSQRLAIELYGTDQILGQQIVLKGRNHTVIGVVKAINSPINFSSIDLDRTVYVSFDSGKSFNLGVGQIQQLLVTVKDPTKIDATRQAIDKTLLENHKGEHDFSVLVGQAIADHNDTFFRTIVIITALVATITLVVGGIGIMNIMLVGVSERTREIGLRKALGATNSHILSQFLIEALIMCVVGGIFGLGIAYGLAFLVATQLAFQPSVTWEITGAGLAMAFGTGIIFGMYPALKAARKDPIESLRQYQ